ncbi:DGQHR domain-containing protein [Priestia megaterium]|uniref:DGQHR domain-containing protein n=1 Tax=Priestia megaterium TaxID=1404 RepID=UPI002D7FE3A4|nr:DGQHR domain-containing protein [Priestia megaterium]MEB4869038.1 DGQHR domain-containing protein [Priestia megaterium]MED4210796.1 DGQHR domain-containing protein [Priestia megaterium]
MKKVKVIPFIQKEKTFYLLSYDPREIIKLVEFPEAGKTQETQRPWDLSRVKEISQYVAGLINLDLSKMKDRTKRKAKGFIPNCPILNIHGNIKIIKENQEYFILLPETAEEIASSKGNVQILDGQHRLISFDADQINENFKSHELYQMGYVICNDFTQDERTEIFIFSNEKQKTVDKNVLRQLMRWLHLLSNDEEDLYDLVVKLNKDTYSPLKGRISIGGEKVKHGFKILQVIKILEKSKTKNILTNQKKLDTDKHLKVLCDYLKAWEQVFPGKFNHPSHTLGKISGLRYVMYLFPSISEILKSQRKKTNVENLFPILTSLRNTKLTDDFFKNDDTNTNLLAFRGETSTIALAEKHGLHLKSIFVDDQEEFDPNN